MASCSNCGTQVQDDVKFCPNCGSGIEAAFTQQQPPQYQQPPQQQYQPPQQQPYQQSPQQQYQPPQQQPYQQPPQQQYQQPPQYPPQQQYQQPQQPYQQPGYPPQQGYYPPGAPGAPMGAAQDAQDNKVMAILSYLLFFVPLLTGAHKTSPFVKFHTNQGTVLFLLCVAWGVVQGILTAIFTAMLFNPRNWTGFGVLGIITTILGLLWLVPSVLAVLGIINAATGKVKELPIIGKFTIIK